MERFEQLKFCSMCIHQKDGMRSGIICDITNQMADFEETCDSYVEDAQLIEQQKQLEMETELDARTAGMGKRFLIYLLDSVFIGVVFFIVLFVVGIIIALIDSSLIESMAQNQVLIYSIYFAVLILYYAIFEATTGKTIAKYVTKTKVVSNSGLKPTLKSIIIRTLCRFIPLDAISFLLNDGVGWHDTISNTVVVNE